MLPFIALTAGNKAKTYFDAVVYGRVEDSNTGTSSLLGIWNDGSNPKVLASDGSSENLKVYDLAALEMSTDGLENFELTNATINNELPLDAYAKQTFIIGDTAYLIGTTSFDAGTYESYVSDTVTVTSCNLNDMSINWVKSYFVGNPPAAGLNTEINVHLVSDGTSIYLLAPIGRHNLDTDTDLDACIIKITPSTGAVADKCTFTYDPNETANTDSDLCHGLVYHSDGNLYGAFSTKNDTASDKRATFVFKMTTAMNSFTAIKKVWKYSGTSAQDFIARSFVSDGTYFYLLGYDGTSPRPTVMIQLDTSLNTVWMKKITWTSLESTLHVPSWPSRFLADTVNGGFFYAYLYPTQISPNNRTNYRVVKISSSGAVVWEKEVNANQFGGGTLAMLPCDEKRIFVAYLNSLIFPGYTTGATAADGDPSESTTTYSVLGRDGSSSGRWFDVSAVTIANLSASDYENVSVLADAKTKFNTSAAATAVAMTYTNGTEFTEGVSPYIDRLQLWE